MTVIANTSCVGVKTKKHAELQVFALAQLLRLCASRGVVAGAVDILVARLSRLAY